MGSVLQPFDFATILPEVVWYLTHNGEDMWCRKPYGFLFTSSDAATAFAATAGSTVELVPIGLGRADLMRDATLTALRDLGVTRLFLDPSIDAASGDVHGVILRLGDGS